MKHSMIFKTLIICSIANLTFGYATEEAEGPLTRNAREHLRIGKNQALQAIDQLTEDQINELGTLHGANRIISKIELKQLIENAKLLPYTTKYREYKGIAYPLIMDYSLPPSSKLEVLQGFVEVFGNRSVKPSPTSIFSRYIRNFNSNFIISEFGYIEKESVARLLLHEVSHIYGIGVKNDIDSVYFSKRFLNISNLVSGEFTCGSYPNHYIDVKRGVQSCSMILADLNQLSYILSSEQRAILDQITTAATVVGKDKLVHWTPKVVLVIATSLRVISFKIKNSSNGQIQFSPFVAAENVCNDILNDFLPNNSIQVEIKAVADVVNKIRSTNLLMPVSTKEDIDGFFVTGNKIYSEREQKNIYNRKQQLRSREICVLSYLK